MSQLDTAKFSSPEQTRTRLPPFSFTPRSPQVSDFPSSQFFSSSRGCFSTGVTQLDAALSVPVTTTYSSPLAARWMQTQPQSQNRFKPSQGEDGPTSSAQCAPGGVRRGEVTEVMGPRGVGKTALAMGIAARALVAGEKVMWIDTSGPVCLDRFKDILRAEIKQKGVSTFYESTSPNGDKRKTTIQDEIDSALTRLLYFHTPTLAHLMALISSPPPGFPPQDTGVLVIDNISTLFSTEFKPFLPPTRPPPTSTSNSIPRRHNRPDPAEKQDKLRWKLLASLLSSLRKLALRLDAAVLTINEMGSRFRAGKRPVLHQALSGVTWDLGVAARIVLYFAWLPPVVRRSGGMGGMSRVRVAEVVKVGGGNVSADDAEVGKQRAVPFLLRRSGLGDVPGEAGLVVRLIRRGGGGGGGGGGMVRSGLLKRKIGGGGLESPVQRRIKAGGSGEEEDVSTDMEPSQRVRNGQEHGNGDDTEGGERETTCNDVAETALGEGEQNTLADAELLLANIPDEEDFD